MKKASIWTGISYAVFSHIAIGRSTVGVILQTQLDRACHREVVLILIVGEAKRSELEVRRLSKRHHSITLNLCEI